MKALVALAFASLLAGNALAQQPPAAQQQPAPPGQTCQSQHVEAPGVSAGALIVRGYDIKAAVPEAYGCKRTERSIFVIPAGRSTMKCCAGACANR